MPYKLAIFDFDGTLADSFPWFLENMNKVAERYNFRSIDRAEAEVLRGKDARQVIRHVGLPMWKIPLVARYWRRLMAAESGGVTLFPGVESMLDGLARRGVKLVIVSSNSEPNIRRILGPQASALFERYECNVSLFGKRARLRRVLRAGGFKPVDVICIGDEIRDFAAANAEGIPFGAVSWGYTTVESLAMLSPREIFTEMEQIVERVG